MKYLWLSWRNLKRHPLRNALTVGAIAIALFCFALLRVFLAGLLNPAEAPATARRLWVRSKVSLAQPLPVGIESKLCGTPGIGVCGKVAWFGGQWKEPKYFFANFAVDAGKLDGLFTEHDFPAPALAEYRALKNAAIIGPDLLKPPYGWKVGETVTLTGTIYPMNAELKIVGVYEPKPGSDGKTLFFRMDYLADGYEGGDERTGTFGVIAAPGASPGEVGRAIDAQFANSPYETKSETEREFQLGFISMLGNIALIVNAVTSAVVIAMLFVAATTVAMSTRERIGEIAVLKTLGFTRGAILVMILVESMLLSLSGAALGLLLTRGGMGALGAAGGGFVPNLSLPLSVAGLTLGVGALMGLLAGGLPAWSASRLRIVDGLRVLN